MTSQDILFPAYTPRDDEQRFIEEHLSLVQGDHKTRVVLLYGAGGTGKTYLIRNLPSKVQLPNILWFGPFDIDDAQYWTLPNLELEIAHSPLASGGYFDEYLDYMSYVPVYERRHVGRETVLAYLRKGSDVFVQCLQKLIQEGKVPVIILDTVESIRGMDIVDKLVRWIGNIPGTLFILAGRPTTDIDLDPFLRQFQEVIPFELKKRDIGEFTPEECELYLQKSSIAAVLTAEEKQKIAWLSKGHPLWLALTVYYLNREGMPREISQYSLSDIQGMKKDEFDQLHESYVRQLLVPYQKRDFWKESELRLAVLRRMVSREIWQNIMADQDLPEEFPDWDTAWKQLLEFPWIRPRANSRYVTLHDALAEELARRIIPAMDKSKNWRNSLWEKAAAVYKALIAEHEKSLSGQQKRLDERLQGLSSAVNDPILADEVLNVDAQRLELDLLQTTSLYYQMLVNYEEGCRKFNSLFDQVLEEHQYRFADLLWAEMQRFLPGETTFDPLQDIVQPELLRFQKWYRNQPAVQYELTRRVAKYLIDKGEAQGAASMLDRVWNACRANLEYEYTILNLRGNAHIRIPGKSMQAEADFKQALKRAQHPKADQKVKDQTGRAYSELGYYYRNIGNWAEAAKAYLEALHVTPLLELKERAAIQSQYAYVQALKGVYQSAYDLVNTALTVRRKLGMKREEGMALSVKGEVHRYERHYPAAWQAYQEAKYIFDTLEDWGWQGLVEQEMAICLYQAHNAGIVLPGYEASREKMLEDARELILKAVEFCKDYSVRSYPSALNRAGRIIGLGYHDYNMGLVYLREGVQRAREVADGWFLFANLIQYAELSYQAWIEGGKQESQYLENIHGVRSQIEDAYKEFNFPDLQGRWEVLQGQLLVDDANAADSQDKRSTFLGRALGHFEIGYPLIARGYIGSHGIIALPEELNKLAHIIQDLPEEKRGEWLETLQGSWSELDKERQEASLSSYLTELYLNVESNTLVQE